MEKNDRYLEFFTGRLLETDALVKGYFLIALEGIQQIFPPYKFFTDENLSLIYNKHLVSVGLPEASLRNSDFAGKMGQSRQVPSGISRGNRIQLEFLLTQDTELITINNYWFNYLDAMFSFVTGGYPKNVAKKGALSINQGIGDTREYGALFHYWLLTPSLEFVSGFVGYGIHPTKMISEELSSARDQVETIRVTIPYSVDYWKVYTTVDETTKPIFESSIISRVYSLMTDKFEQYFNR